MSAYGKGAYGDGSYGLPGVQIFDEGSILNRRGTTMDEFFTGTSIATLDRKGTTLTSRSTGTTLDASVTGSAITRTATGTSG